MQIIIDTREQRPYTFETCRLNWQPDPPEVIRKTLKTGDYSVAGCETAVTIERKSVSDLYGTMGTGRHRFERELKRMESFQWAAVLVEGSLGQVLADSGQFSPKALVLALVQWQQVYKARWIFADSRELAEAICFRALERFWRYRDT